MTLKNRQTTFLLGPHCRYTAWRHQSRSVKIFFSQIWLTYTSLESLWETKQHFIKNNFIKFNGRRVIASYKLDQICDLYFDIADNSFICIRSRQKNLITAKNKLYVWIIGGVMMVSQSNKCILTHSLFKIFEFRNYAIRSKVLLIQSYKLFENQFQQKPFRDTLKTLHDFKSTQKIVWSIVLWYVKVFIFRKCIQYSIHWDKTQMFKKFLWTK